MAAIFCSLSSCAATSGKQSTTAEFEKLIQTDMNAVLLDVRTPQEFAENHIPGAINIDQADPDFISKVKAQIPTDKEIAVYCRSGHRSADAAARLEKEGYKTADLEGGILAWEQDELPVTHDGNDYYTAPDGKAIEIQPLIHASLCIKYGDQEIEIDPVGKMGDRSTDYAVFPKADLILVTHEHYDHYDPEAIKTLSKADTTVITNGNVHEMLGYGTAMKNGDKLALPSGIEIEAVPAYNTTPERSQFHPKGRDNGYILNLGGLRVYIAGDTEVIPEMKDFKDIDIAFLPCNLPYTMTPAQLIEAAEIIKPKVVYPYHYGETDLSSITPALAEQGIYVRICPFDPGK